MKTIFIDAKYDGEIKLNKESINYFTNNKIKTVALFASVQFLELGDVKKELEKNNIKILTTKAKRTDKPIQVLGCDCYQDSFEDNTITKADAILYIGDGMFHPQALLFAQRNNKTIKDIIIWDPIAKNMKIINKNEINENLKKLKANLKRYIAANIIGILVTTKPGQQYLDDAIKLKSGLEKQGKKAYIFIDDTFNLDLLENYNFIEAWVNTACPRIGLDDHMNTNKALINIKEAFGPIKALEELHF